MPHYSLDILNTLDRNWRDLWIEVVTFPAPPVPAKGRVYPEDSWRSDVLERGTELFSELGHEVVESQLTGHGPAFLLRRNLGSLFKVVDGRVGFNDRMYCAEISSATILRAGDVNYAVDSVIEGIMAISQSCHPGSHTAVPGAPYLNAMFQVQTAKDTVAATPTYKYASQSALAKYFPEAATVTNERVDQLFRYLSLSDVLDLHDRVIKVENFPETVKLSSKLSDDVRFTVETTLLRNEGLAGRFQTRDRFLEFIRKVGGQHATL